LREERGRIRDARRALMPGRIEVGELLGCDRRLHRIGSARRERGQRIAQRLCARAVAMRMAVVEMDELAELVDVLDRVLQRRLPAGKQGENEKKST
jgi:hypothetical protein